MISRVASLTSSSRPAGDDRRPSITSESDWRVRIDAGTLFAMGCLLAGAGSLRRRCASLSKDAPLPNFPASLGLHLGEHVVVPESQDAEATMFEEPPCAR